MGQALQLLARRYTVGTTRLRALRNDALLAATALVHGAAVMTLDRAISTGSRRYCRYAW